MNRPEGVSPTGVVARRRSWTDAALIAWARAAQQLGWTGGVGLIALSTAALVGWQAMHVDPLATEAMDEPAAEAVPSDQLQPVWAPDLPTAAGAPETLAEIERLARSEGLQWPHASYQISPLDADHLARLEVRCRLQGSYAQLRRFLARLLNGFPALAIQHLEMGRRSEDPAAIEATLQLSIYLRDGWVDPIDLNKPGTAAGPAAAPSTDLALPAADARDRNPSAGTN